MKDNRLLNRFKTEYDFKTFVTSFISLVVTVIFAVYNGFLGIYHASLWHGAIDRTRGLDGPSIEACKPDAGSGYFHGRLYDVPYRHGLHPSEEAEAFLELSGKAASHDQFWLFILVLSVLAIRRGIRQIKGFS